MAQENSAMEMGTSDQVLVTSRKKKNITYILGFIAMVVVLGVVIALVVIFSGNEGGEVAEPIISTTQGPTSATTTTQAPLDPEPTTPIPGPEPEPTTLIPDPEPEPVTPIPEPGLNEEIELESIINGVFTPNTFNGAWANGNQLMYQNDDNELVVYDVDTNTTRVLVSNTSEILQKSSRVTKLSADGTHVVLSYNIAPVYRYSFLAQYSAINVETGDVVDIIPPGLTFSDAFLQNFVWGPTGTSSAFVYLNNIYYKSSLSVEPQQITTNGQLNIVYNGIPDWVYEEEVFASDIAMWFSSDGTKLAYATFDDTNVRVMKVPHYGVPGSINWQYTKHHEIRYPKPGTTNPTASVTLRDLATGNTNTYSAPTDLDQPILKPVTFVSGDTVALTWTNRAQTSIRIYLCTQGQATCNEIYSYTETDGWIDNIPIKFNAAGNAFITILPQSVNGVLYKQVVQVSQGAQGAAWSSQNRVNTAHTVADILYWSNDNVIWYKATSVSDSAEQHIFSVNAAGTVSCFSCGITREDGSECLYNDATFSSDGTRTVVNCAGPNVPETFIYETDGTLVRSWDSNVELSSLLENTKVPSVIRVSAQVADGYPNADVQIQVPSDYESRTNVPLLVYVYGGPDTAMVTKQWSLDWGASLVSRWNIAVAVIDGRGSGLKGVANMFAVNRRLGSVEIDDQIAVTRYLHENYQWIDSNRTCIWGWSYGGYAASLALARGGDVFRCAAAVAPVVDWRFYDTIYTERYMDTPQNNAEGYTSSSLLTESVVDAYRNKSYFLIHGTADDNVHYQHAMLFSRLLQRRDVYFTQMSYTDEDHGLVGVRPHLYHALEKFLQENML